MQKRILSIALCLLLVLAFAPAQAAVPEAVTVALVLPTGETINPLTTKYRDPLNMLSLVYEGLVKLDDNREPVPCLAESWEVTGDGRRFIFTLRSGLAFHDGTPVTADDVCATLEYIWLLCGFDEDRKTEVPLEDRGVHANLYAYIRSWKALENNKVEITTTRSYYGLLNAMTFPVLPAASMGEELPPGTGPYRIEEYTPDDRLWITAWYEYRETPPNVQNIVGYFYQTTDEALQAYEYLDVDIALTRSLTATRYSGSLKSFFLPYRTRQLEVLLMHHGTSPLGSANVRRAITAAIDISSIMKNAYQSMALPVTTFITPGTWLSDANLSAQAYNVSQAMQLLEDEGWILTDDGFRYKTVDGEPKKLKFSIMTYDEAGSSARRNAAAAIQEYLAVVGIDSSLDSVTYTRAREKLRVGGFELALCAFEMDVVPDPGFLFTSDTNYCRYRSDAMSNLVTDLRKQFTSDGYYEAMLAIQRQYLEDLPFVCLYYRMGALLTRYSYTSARDVREKELLRGIEVWE